MPQLSTQATASPPGSGRVSAAMMPISRLAVEPLRHHVAAQDEQRDRQDQLLVERDPHVLEDVVELALAPDDLHIGCHRQQDHHQRLAQHSSSQHQ